MTATFAPFGLRAISAFGTHGNEVRAYPLPNGASCPSLQKGAPVRMTAGVVASIGTGGQAPVLGVVNGFGWVDSVTGPQLRNSIPAAVSSAGLMDGDNRPTAYVIDNPEATFYIQANASVTAGDLGLNFEVTTLGEDTIYGVSRYALRAASRTSAITGALKVVGLARIPGNEWGDAFTVVQVKINRSILTEASAV